MDKQLVVFEDIQIRRVWDELREEWYFSVVDVVRALTDSLNPTDYLKKMRKRDIELGLYIGTNCPQVAMTTIEGKRRKTLAGTTEQIFRIIAKQGGHIAKNDHVALESKTGKKVVTSTNYLTLRDTKKIK